MDFMSENGGSDCPIYRIKEYGIVCSYTMSMGGCVWRTSIQEECGQKGMEKPIADM